MKAKLLSIIFGLVLFLSVIAMVQAAQLPHIPKEDITPPVITLLGDEFVEIEVGDTYVDAGATALDDYDGDITEEIVTISSVDTNVVGDYQVIYNVQDAAGNIADMVMRIVTVTEDTTAPKITAISPEDDETLDDSDVTLRIKLDENPEDLEYIEYSLNGGDNITMTEVSSFVFESESLDLEDGESYTVTYYVKDLNGNSNELTIEFDVDESTASTHEETSFSAKYPEGYEGPSPVLTIDLRENSLNWWQCLVNKMARLFHLEEVY